MRTKYFLVFLVLLLSQISAKAIAQKCLVFNYDQDGNRISRFVQNNCLETKDVLKVEENEEVTDILVYPNPNCGNFKIIMPENAYHEHAYYRIYDLNGTVVIENNLIDETDVDIMNWPSGVYLLQIISGEETFSKIIVKH